MTRQKKKTRKKEKHDKARQAKPSQATARQDTTRHATTRHDKSEFQAAEKDGLKEIPTLYLHVVSAGSDGIPFFQASTRVS